jgi:hypothetical protein
LPPLIIIGVVAPDVDHAINRAGTAKGLAARQI